MRPVTLPRPRRLITTQHRRGRVTPRQAAALAAGSPALLAAPEAPLDLDALFGVGTPVVLDIGFGTGGPVAEAALRHPEQGILAVDMHTPGIGDLLCRIEEHGLANVRVVDADVRDVVERGLAPGSLAGARTFFPDPWPKKRHQRRRLVQRDFIDLLASRVRPGGFWHLATDWPEYAEAMLVEIPGAWSGGIIPRPADRPLTRYERNGLTAGRSATDLWFTRIER